MRARSRTGLIVSTMTMVMYPSGTGLTLPTSGQLVGMAADFLRLKGFVGSDGAISSRTAERYYRGDHVEAESVAAIFDALVVALVPHHLPDGEVFVPAADVRAWCRQTLESIARRWDTLASTLTSEHFPILSPVDAPLPFLRFVAFDAGIRWAAFQTMQQRRGESIAMSPTWLAHDGLRKAIDARRSQLKPEPTIAQLARRARVSKNTMDAWRSGTSCPTDANLDELAAALVADTVTKEALCQERARIKSELRLAAGIGAAWHKLGTLVSDRRHIDNLVQGLNTASRRTFAHFATLDLARGPGDAALLLVVKDGASSPLGAIASRHLASLCQINQEVEADLSVLPDDWCERIGYWFRHLGTQEAAIPEVASRTRVSRAQARDLARAVVARLMQMGNFDAKLQDFAHHYVLKGDATWSANNRYEQALRAWTCKRPREALEHLERAIELKPDEPYYWQAMGAWLGELVRAGSRQFVEPALAALARAVDLDPTNKVAATGVGIVLHNAGAFEFAEELFAAIGGFASDWHHYHYARGFNFFALGDLDRAQEHLDTALTLDPENQMVRAHLAQVLFALGRTSDAERLAREVEHRTGRNPLQIG